MRATPLFVVVFVAGWLVACVPETAQPGALQAFATACDKPNEGLRIAVDGYLRLPDTLDSTDRVVLRLYMDLSFTGKPIGVTMKFGDGPNEARRITSSFRDEDLKVRMANGEVVPFRTRVRVSGKMYFPIVPQDFDCGLDNPYVEATN
jgi:hypothetical protein